jgi:hydrogenase maturation protein HypF
VDDSVTAVHHQQPMILRRGRGYAPGVVAQLPTRRPILALGADLKNAIALVVEGEVIVSQHIGDLGDWETDRAFEETVHDLLKMYDIRQRDLTVAYDRHPEFVSSRFAERLNCDRRVAVQHHRAHVASVMAEHRLPDRRVIGVALDGTGYGDDGAIWGCELFVGSVAAGFRRAAHLRAAALAGGDAAARWPVQAAAGFLAELSLPDLTQAPFEFPHRYGYAQQLVQRGVRCFQTTSAGRLFDTVAALCGFTREVSYEGQAAIWLEHQATSAGDTEPAAYPFADLDYRPLLTCVVEDRLAGREVAEIALAFHAALANALASTIGDLANQLDVQCVAISGGVFQNRLLCNLLIDRLRRRPEIEVLWNIEVPGNDGGIALGQAALASVVR